MFTVFPGTETVARSCALRDSTGFVDARPRQPRRITIPLPSVTSGHSRGELTIERRREFDGNYPSDLSDRTAALLTHAIVNEMYFLSVNQRRPISSRSMGRATLVLNMSIHRARRQVIDGPTESWQAVARFLYVHKACECEENCAQFEDSDGIRVGMI
jgi:hypothetical protein